MKFKHMKKYTFLLLTLLLTASLQAFEKVGITSFQFLKVPTDARSTAMAEAYTAAVNGSDAVFWNPGALTKAPDFDIMFSYMDYFLDVTHSSLSASYRVDGIGTFGLQALFVDIGDIEVTTREALGFVGDEFNPGLTGETIHPTTFAAGISYARSLTNKFSFGLTSKIVHEDLVRKAVTMLVFDGGLIYQTGFKSLELSAVVRHFGAQVQYIDRDYPLPQTFNIGVAMYLISAADNMWMDSNNQSLMFTADLIQPRDYDQQYNIGLEYGFQNLFFLRGGYKLHYDEEGLTLGFGLNYSNYRIDYSYSDFGEFLDSVHRFSIGLGID